MYSLCFCLYCSRRHECSRGNQEKQINVRNCLSVLVEQREHNRRIIRFSALCIRLDSELILKFDVFFLLCSTAKLNSVLFKC